jgi:hypothetical protein
MGEARMDAYRLDFDRKVKVEFHGTKLNFQRFGPFVDLSDSYVG